MAEVPAAPPGLGQRGAAFWSTIVDEFELSPPELELLTEACRTIDLCERLAEQVDSDGLMVPGSMGQDRLHPAVTELRGARLSLGRLLGQIDMPDEDGQSVPSPRQVSASRAGAVSRPSNVTRLHGSQA